MSSEISSVLSANASLISTRSTPAHFDAIIRIDRVEATRERPDGSLKRRSAGTALFICMRCSSWSSPHRTNAVKHVLSKHPVPSTSTRSTPSTPIIQQEITSLFAPQTSANGLRNAFNQQAYREAIVGLLTRRKMPFSAVEWSEMKDLALACNPAIGNLLITSRRTVVRYIASNYNLYRAQIRESLSTAITPIHISSDLWTSPHRHALLAVCAQWVDCDYQLQKALLALPECRFNHSGHKQASLILQTLEAFDIQSRLGYHTGDNATSNDTCIEVLESELFTKYGIKFNSKRRRVRCIGHIINLSLQAFLLASSKEALLAALETVADVSGEELIAQFSNALDSQQRREHAPTDETQQSQSSQGRTRRRGSWDNQSSLPDEYSGIQNIPALQKLHRLAVWLRNSSIHANLWDKEVGIRLGIDNQTRWSSWYMVIDRAVRRQGEIKIFMAEHEDILGTIRITSSDWDLLGKAHAFLQPFASATLYAEGDKSSISQSLLIMDSLLVHYEREKEHYSSQQYYDARMLRSIEMGWFILDKYYSMTGDVPAYAAALLLDPSRRTAYLKKNWPRAWLQPAIRAASTIWEDEFKIQLSKASPRGFESMPPPLRSSKPRSAILESIMRDMEVTTSDAGDEDDFMTFINAPTFRIDCTPLEWWCRKEQYDRYPRLSKMAISILSIPAESSEPERTFSGARRTCSWDRLSLSCMNIERIECISSWLREGHIRPLHLNGMGLPKGASGRG